MARASSANAASPQTALTTWCPASVDGARGRSRPTTVSRMASRSDRVRTNSGVPGAGVGQDAAGGRVAACAPAPRAPRTTTTVSATPIASCVSAVPEPGAGDAHADAVDEHDVEDRVARRRRARATTSGVRVSSSPRSAPGRGQDEEHPGQARAPTSAGRSRPAAATSPDAPSAVDEPRRASSQVTAASTTPRPRASHMPSTPTCSAPAAVAAPRRRATAAVVA